MKNSKTKKLIMSSLFAALICIATSIIVIPSPMSGYVNLGDGIVLLSAFIIGPAHASIASAIGSMLADVFCGYSHYAIGTFIIKGLVAFVAGKIYEKVKSSSVIGPLFAGVVGEIIMIVGYFGYASLILGRGLAAAASIPGNIMQAIAGIFSSVILLFLLKKSKLQ